MPPGQVHGRVGNPEIGRDCDAEEPSACGEGQFPGRVREARGERAEPGTESRRPPTFQEAEKQPGLRGTERQVNLAGAEGRSAFEGKGAAAA